MESTYLLPLTIGFVIIAVVSLAYRAKRRRGYPPFFVGLFAAALILTDKFVILSNPLLYVGVGLLFAASLWNAWPRRTAQIVSATPSETLYQLGSRKSEVEHE